MLDVGQDLTMSNHTEGMGGLPRVGVIDRRTHPPRKGPAGHKRYTGKGLVRCQMGDRT